MSSLALTSYVLPMAGTLGTDAPLADFSDTPW